jgi:hypothetical protein
MPGGSRPSLETKPAQISGNYPAIMVNFGRD